MIDAHLHLDKYRKDKVADLINEWQDHSISGVIAVSTNLQSCYETLEWQVQFPDFVYPCIGWHPEQRLPCDKELLELIQLIHSEKDRIVGIGEIGLPHYSLGEHDSPPLEPYIEVLSVLLREAKAVNLPVALHAVHDKAAKVFELLQCETVRKAHFHWLKADNGTLEAIIEAEYVVSVTPEVCYRQRDQVLASRVPLDLLMLETDGPWPFSGPFQGIETTPMFLEKTARKIANLKDISIEKAKKQIRVNTQNFYRLLK